MIFDSRENFNRLGASILGETLLVANKPFIGISALVETMWLLRRANVCSLFEFFWRSDPPSIVSQDVVNALTCAESLGFVSIGKKTSPTNFSFDLFTVGNSDSIPSLLLRNTPEAIHIIEWSSNIDPVLRILAVSASFFAYSGSTLPWEESFLHHPVMSSNGRGEKAITRWKDLVSAVPSLDFSQEQERSLLL